MAADNFIARLKARAYWATVLAPLLILAIGIENPWPSSLVNLVIASAIALAAVFYARTLKRPIPGKTTLAMLGLGFVLLAVYLGLWSQFVVSESRSIDGGRVAQSAVIGYERLESLPDSVAGDSDLELMLWTNWSPELGWTGASLLTVRLALVLSYSLAFGLISAGVAIFQIQRNKAANVRELSIFLGSSRELRNDRDEFDLYFRQQNDRLRQEGLYLKIIRWENFLDTLSETRKQDDYNQAVAGSDIAVFLFMSKTGEFTEEEFDIAHQSFKAQGKPHILTYFKSMTGVDVDHPEQDRVTLENFKDKLSDLGHYYSVYDNDEHLKRHFRDQLDMLVEKGVFH